MQTEKITSIRRLGFIDTVDIEVDNDSHIFYGNGIATSNSHAVSYGIVAYMTAYGKAHMPEGFFTSYLKHSLNEGEPSEEIRELVNNTKLLNIEVYPPDIRKRNKHFKLFDDGIFFGLIDIKGIGESAYNKINNILSSVEKPMETWTKLDFIFRIAPKIGFNNAVALISSGAVAFLDGNRTLMLYECQKVQELTDKELGYIIEHVLPKGFTSIVQIFQHILSLPVGRGKAISNKARHAKISGLYNSLLKPTHNLEDSAGWIARTEKQLLGVAITCSEVDDCDISFANSTCKEFLDGHRANPIIGVKLEKIREITIKNGKSAGKKMAFLSVSDSSCSMDKVTMFSEAYDKYRSLLLEGNMILLAGKRDSKRGGLIVDKIWQLK